MLTILKVVPEAPKPFFKRMWTDIVGTKPSANLLEAAGVSYIEITAEENKNGIPWKKVELISLDCAGKMLLPKDVFPPEKSGVTRFIPNSYPDLLMFKLLISVLKNAEDKNKVSVAVYDEAITYPKIIEIVKNAGEIKFLTNKPFEKVVIQEKIIEETGAAVTFTDKFEIADKCKVIYAPKGLPFNILGNQNSLVFAPKGRCKGTVIKNAGLEIPKEFKDIYNDMYDKIEFMSAFYEIGESKLAEKVQPDKGIGLFKIYKLDELIEILNSNQQN